MRFGLLGPLQVEDGAGNVRPVAGACQRLLLAALLVHVNRVMPARELAEIVWDGVPPAAEAALRTKVMRLRRALGPDAAARIMARDPGYVITLSAEELDISAFEARHQQAGAAMRAGRWDETARLLDLALALCRGKALLDVESPVLRDECGERLEQLRVQAIESLRRRILSGPATPSVLLKATKMAPSSSTATWYLQRPSRPAASRTRVRWGGVMAGKPGR
jgi:DNA-binding SARP family transcriptional activator